MVIVVLLRYVSFLLIRSFRVLFSLIRSLIDWARDSMGLITLVESSLSIFALIFASNLTSRIEAILAAMSSGFSVVFGVDTVETDGVFSCDVVSFFCFFVCFLSDSSENSAVFRTAMLLRRCQAFWNGRLIGSGWVRAFCIAHFAASVRSSPWGFPPFVWTSLSMWLDTSFNVRLPFV